MLMGVFRLLGRDDLLGITYRSEPVNQRGSTTVLHDVNHQGLEDAHARTDDMHDKQNPSTPGTGSLICSRPHRQPVHHIRVLGVALRASHPRACACSLDPL